MLVWHSPSVHTVKHTKDCCRAFSEKSPSILEVCRAQDRRRGFLAQHKACPPCSPQEKESGEILKIECCYITVLYSVYNSSSQIMVCIVGECSRISHGTIVHTDGVVILPQLACSCFNSLTPCRAVISCRHFKSSKLAPSLAGDHLEQTLFHLPCSTSHIQRGMCLFRANTFCQACISLVHLRSRPPLAVSEIHLRTKPFTYVILSP